MMITIRSGLKSSPTLNLLFLSFTLISCTNPPISKASKENLSPLVFLHGLKGSSLVNAQGDVKWITPLQAINLSTPDLKLPMKWNNGVQDRDDLTPKEIIKDVSMLFGLIGPQIYGPWIDAVKELGNSFYPFAYDWRRDNLESLELFSQFIERVRKENKGAKIKLVAHSMGGTIGLAYLNQHPEYFSSATFAGSPFSGGIAFLRDLQQGTATGLNHKILSPEVLLTYPTSYSFFALDGRGLVESDGTPIPMDFYSLKQLKEKKVAIFASQLNAENSHNNLLSSKELDTFLETTLKRAKTFRMLMKPLRKKYPPILVITSKDWSTLDLMVRNGPKSILGWDFETGKKTKGDGLVAAKDAIPAMNEPCRVFYSSQEHTFLLNDPKSVIEIGKMP
jgi:pimeloyl-ACP methyl ester carboxylesterase